MPQLRGNEPILGLNNITYCWMLVPNQSWSLKKAIIRNLLNTSLYDFSTSFYYCYSVGNENVMCSREGGL
jgi:hypothetical protein